PLSRNGRNATVNRYPAHKICNEAKGNPMIHPEEFTADMQLLVIPLLRRLGHEVTNQCRKRAIRRVVEGWPPWARRLCRESNRVALDRWENEGGSTRCTGSFRTECRDAVPASRDGAKCGEVRATLRSVR